MTENEKLIADVTELQEVIDGLELEVGDLRRLIEAWRTSLRVIANAESGTWGWIAKEALDLERKMVR